MPLKSTPHLNHEPNGYIAVKSLSKLLTSPRFGFCTSRMDTVVHVSWDIKKTKLDNIQKTPAFRKQLIILR